MFGLNFMEILYMIIPIMLALSVHEYAHARMAYAMGDPTAAIAGRMTLDPTKHVDVFGMLMLLLVGFGWARPVPFNPDNLKNRRLGTILISIAGPASNFVLAIIAAIILKFTHTFANQIISYILIYTITINVGFGVFNLFPIPPLDGSKILASLLPGKLEQMFYKYENFIYIILVVLIFTGVLTSIVLPVIKPISNFLLKFALGA